MSYFGQKDIMLEISRGNHPGWFHFNKFGRNDASASDTLEVLWTSGGATYPHPATADITHIRQTVDAAADRGAQIEVQGLDTNWDRVTQTVNLDATDSTTPVALTTALRRVFRKTAQHSTILVNNTELRNVGGGTTYAVITAGVNQTQMALGTVPAGFTAYMVRYYGSVAKITAKDPTSTTFGLYTADNANGYAFRMRHEINTGGTGRANHEFGPQLKITEKSDVIITSTCFDNAGSVNGGFDVIVIPNT